MAPRGADQDKEHKQRRRPGRVPTSCAECRRLKLKCDRKAPCETCVKRGCASICPDGQLTSGKGNRLVLANTEELHDRIERLTTRVRELEDALKELQATVSDRPHPLLMTELPQLRPLTQSASTSAPPVPDLPPTYGDPAAQNDEETILDAFGTLTIGPGGETSFLGPTARSEYLINVHNTVFPKPFTSYPHLSPEMVEMTDSLSGLPMNNPELGEQIFSFLPPLSEAIRLCEQYLYHGQYIWSPMPRDDLFNEVLSEIYRVDSFAKLRSPYHLCFLYIAFALGMLHDPDKPPYNVEADEYSRLAWVAFKLAPLDRELNLVSVLAMAHIAQYMELADLQQKGSSRAWIHCSLATKFAQMIGLHLNSGRWRLDATTSEKRSRVFWQVFLLDTWLSFGVGRPPSLSSAYIDCALPKDLGVVTINGKEETGYHAWTWQFTRLMHNLMPHMYGATVPPYTTVIDWDRKIRDFPVPMHLRPLCDDRTAPDTLVIRRWFVLSCKEFVLLNLHRSYFAQALKDMPNDLLKHRYGPSVMAAYRSAWRLIEALKTPVKQAPHLLRRISLVWSQGLSAAIVMCLLVTLAPGSSLTESSLEELDTIAGLFAQMAPTCPVAAHNLPSVERLRTKGHEAVNHSQTSEEAGGLSHTELDRIGGRTHLISVPPGSSDSSSTPSASTSSPEQQDASTSPAITMPPGFENAFPGAAEYVAYAQLHPTIMQDMKVFDGVDPANFNAIFDFPPDSFPQAMTDVQYTGGGGGTGVFGGDIFNAPTSSVAMDGEVAAGGAGGGSAGLVQTPPVQLDATWQSFVEQLGF